MTGPVDSALAENVRLYGERLLEFCLWHELLKAGCARAHVVTYTQQPTAFGATVLGMSHPDLDWQFRKHLANEWRGRGVAVFVNDLLLSVRYPDPRDFRRAFCAIVIHEAAHAAENGPIVPANVEVSELRAAGFDYALSQNTYESPVLRGRPPFWGHGECFLRIALHLVYRVRRSGLSISDDAIMHAPQYGLSPMEQYADALADEREQFRRRVPISSVKLLPPPDAFTELFNRDCARWFALNERVTQIERERIMVKTQQASSDELLAKIEADRTALLKQRADAYRALVECVADGSEPKADDVTRALDGMGKSAAELAKDVRLLLRRRALRVIVDRQPAEEAERAEVMRKIEEERERFRPLQEAHENALRAFGFRIEQLNESVVNQNQAADELRRTAPDALQSQLADVEQEIRPLHHGLNRIEKEIGEKRDRANRLDRGLNYADSEMRKDEAAEVLKEVLAKIAELESKRDSLRSEIATVDARRAELTEALLRP